jgi:nucleoside-diphosphate-sugar epimerase
MTKTPRVLITGAFGQIGSELITSLSHLYPPEQIFCLDLHIPPDFSGQAFKLDVSDSQQLAEFIRDHRITEVFHLVSLLSATGEANPDLAWQLNLGSLKTVLDLARETKMKVFWPSSIAAFGPTTPRDQTPQHTILEPQTMYGVTKVAGELLCQYYFLKYGVDVRSLRYPGVLSWKTPPGGGTTDYAVAIFPAALATGKYTCFLKSDTTLPMIYIDDAVRATVELMQADPAALSVRTSYNLAAISFSPRELAAEISRHVPLRLTYTPDHRQKIADSWPRSIDDSCARHDWGWRHTFDLPALAEAMLTGFKSLYGQN